MFLGHFGLALASKKADRKLSLATAFMAAQFVDLLWPLLLITGVEDVNIDPGNTVVTPLDFAHYPYSHSLLAGIVWGVALGIAYYLIKKTSKGALIVGSLVLSHWFLDLLMHRPDLPLSFSGETKYGLGLWNNLPLTIAIELVLLLAGAGIYMRATQPKNLWGTISIISLLVFLITVYMLNVFGDPPPNSEVIGYVGFAQWLFVGWAYWCDATRVPFGEMPAPKRGIE